MQKGKVVRYIGDSANALTDAIESGMLTADAKRICEEVALENQELKKTMETLKHENSKLRGMLTVERRINRTHRTARMAGYNAADEEYERMKRTLDLRMTLFVLVFASAAIAATMMAVWAVLK